MPMCDTPTSVALQECASRVLCQLGWGWKECVYREALAAELRRRNYDVSTEVALPIKYDSSPLSNVYAKVDMLLNGDTVIELKSSNCSVASLSRAKQQCYRYMTCCCHGNSGIGYVIVFPDARDSGVSIFCVKL